MPSHTLLVVKYVSDTSTKAAENMSVTEDTEVVEHSTFDHKKTLYFQGADHDTSQINKISWHQVGGRQEHTT